MNKFVMGFLLGATIAAAITAAVAASGVTWVDYNDKPMGTTTNPIIVTTN